MVTTIHAKHSQSQEERSISGRKKLWIVRILMGLVTLVVLLTITGFIYETTAHAADMKNYPGQRIDIGGYALHINCIGSGSTTVVLEAGMGESSLSWAGIHSQLANTTGTQVCAYDRAGYGWSDAAPDTVDRSAQQVVTELHTLLDNAGVEPPYVLVGHSLGGLVVRLYMSEYPQEVAGMILLDSTHEDVVQFAPEFTDVLSMQRSFQSIMSALARVGVTRVFGDYLVTAMRPDFPATLKPHIPVMYSASAFQTANRELDSLAETWEQVAASRASDPTWEIPLKVLYSPESIETVPDWANLQADISSLSQSGELIFADKSGHFVHYGQPDLVINAIAEVINVVRRS